MSWQEILGHEHVIERFRRSFLRERLASTYLFVGPAGIGKKMVALELARALLCEQSPEPLEACGSCPSCLQATQQSHPDLILVNKPADKNSIPIESFIGDREHRRQRGLCHDISLTPFYGRRKIAIIDDADFLNIESANCLLKTLEEPPANSLLILIGTSEQQQLPTILSRSQVVRFRPLHSSQLTEILSRQQTTTELDLAQLVAAAEGSVRRAYQLNDPELFEFRQLLFTQLASLEPAQSGFSKTLCDFVDSSSKLASERRELMRLIADFALQFFRATMHLAVHQRIDENLPPSMQTQIEALVALFQVNERAQAEILTDAIIRTTEFQWQVSANLASANIVPAWLQDLGAIMRMEKRCV